MAQPLEPREMVRRLTLWRDMRETHLLKDIAVEAGIDSSNMASFLYRHGVNENTVQDMIDEWTALMEDDDRLLLDVAEAYKNHKTMAQGARAMDMGYVRFKNLLRRAADRGLDGSTPMPVPIGQQVKGISTLYVTDPATGETMKRMDWVKTAQDPHSRRTELLEQWGDEIRRLIVPQKPVDLVRPAEQQQEQLLTHYCISDAHLGSLAVLRETGNTWGLVEAERILTQCYDMMIALAPPAKTAVVCFLGDTQDYDSLISETPASRHVLDSDARLGEMVRATVRLQKHAVMRALQHHEMVYFLDAEANHDPTSSTVRRALWSEVFGDNPRVKVIDSDLPYYAMNFGNVMLGWHHGHLAPKHKLNEIFADEFPVEWSIAGKQTKRFIHVGHLHRRIESEETRGADILYHPTLAGRNAWAARHGMRSLRRARCHTYHKTYGDVGSKTVSPEMVQLAEE